MSTILKALRRLEEDGSDKDKENAAEAEVHSEVDALSAEAPRPPSEADRVAPREALREPRASDDLRERILSEERASEAIRSESKKSARSDRPPKPNGETRNMEPSGRVSVGEPTPDPFENRVVEPAFTPPSTSTYPESASAPLSPASFGRGEGAASLAGAGGLFSNKTFWGLLGAGLVLAVGAGLFLGGATPPATTGDSLAQVDDAAQVTKAPVAPRPAAIPQAPAEPKAPAVTGSLPAAIAEAQPPIRPMTVPRAETTDSATEIASQDSKSALARAEVRPTRAVREAKAAPVPSPSPSSPTPPSQQSISADPMVAARPRPERFSGERARVSAPGPSRSIPTPPSPPTRTKTTETTETTETMQVAKAEAPEIKDLPLAEIAPSSPSSSPSSFSSPSLPTSLPPSPPISQPSSPSSEQVRESVMSPRAGTTRPSVPSEPTVRPEPKVIASAAATSMAESAPAVDLAQRRSLPDLTVIRTSWHPAADRRSAKIRLEAKNELVTLREGDAVGGMVIQEISPSAVVFSAGDVQIRRRVGEAGR